MHIQQPLGKGYRAKLVGETHYVKKRMKELGYKMWSKTKGWPVHWVSCSEFLALQKKHRQDQKSESD